MKEEWREIKGYEGMYEVSNWGRVRRAKDGPSTWKGKIMKLGVSSKGYHQVDLVKAGARKSLRVARIVGIAFISNPNNLPQINHRDGVKLHDWADNLEWNTAAQNIQHAFKNGLVNSRKGEKNNKSKLTEIEVVEVKQLLEAGKLLQREIGAIFGVTQTGISSIKTGRSWCQLKE